MSGRHCLAPFSTADGYACCRSHRQCRRHWRTCAACGSAAGRTVPLPGTDELRQAEALALAKIQERERLANDAQGLLPLGKR